MLKKRYLYHDLINHAMRLVFPLIFILLVLVQPFIHTMVYLNFTINQKEIARELCEKRNVRNNTCQGCCQLKKQLEKSEERSERNSPKKNTAKTEIIYLNNTVSGENLRPLPSLSGKLLLRYLKGITTRDFIGSVFHPPKTNRTTSIPVSGYFI